jgi:hypothetical protein
MNEIGVSLENGGLLGEKGEIVGAVVRLYSAFRNTYVLYANSTVDVRQCIGLIITTKIDWIMWINNNTAYGAACIFYS